MIGEQELAAMKDGVRIVNCARGGIVDEDCLVAALKSGKVAGAALDVFSQEPVTNHPLFSLPNVVVTPHLGASTYEAQDYNSMAIAEQVLKVLHGQPVENAVNLPMVAPEEWQTLARYLPMAEILGRCFAQSGVRSIDTLHLLFEGELAALPTALLTNTVLKGVLAEVVSEPVNHINAALIAKRRGIKVIESRSSNGSGYRQRMVLKSESEPDRQVGVTLGPAGETRIIDVHGYRLDLVPEQHMILAPHTDKPGIIGKVGSTIGNYGINIAAMQVGRRAVGGPAVMALVLDDAATDEILEQVKAVDGIKDARRVELPESLVKQG
jgi:D-3-phosphoglycerate dehydrogenase